jgi:hemerythrin-like domain-containing protein
MAQMTDALSLLHEDHEKVKQLFDEFEHAEEELFYPTVRQAPEGDELIAEATEEHHVVDVLAAEIRDLDPEDEQYKAKFMVPAENVKHHIEEEEQQIFPKIETLQLDFDELGERMAQRKQELMQQMANGAPKRKTTRSSGSAAGRSRSRSRRKSSSKSTR